MTSLRLLFVSSRSLHDPRELCSNSRFGRTFCRFQRLETTNRVRELRRRRERARREGQESRESSRGVDEDPGDGRDHPVDHERRSVSAPEREDEERERKEREGAETGGRMTRTRARSDEKSSPKVVKSRVFDQLSVVVWNNFSSMFSVAISSGDCSPSRMVSRAPGGRPDDGWRSSRDPPPSTVGRREEGRRTEALLLD